MPLVSLLARGYFPIELPDPFDTKAFARAVDRGRIGGQPFTWHGRPPMHVSRPGTYNLARAGSLRRPLQVPNPVNFFHIATVISTNWASLRRFTRRSHLSLSTPTLGPAEGRAITPRNDFPEIKAAKLRTRTGARYALLTDIDQYYPSIYTHSIPWALHSKPTAKANRAFSALLGNQLDHVVRYGQDQQTKGIPIGPDTSLVLAEILLTAVDRQLHARGIRNGFRYIDDYELPFRRYEDANEALGILQEILSEFELTLNPKKTEIIELPANVEAPWVTELRQVDLRTSRRAQRTDLIDYFDKTLDLRASHPDQAVLSYAVARTESIPIFFDNWNMFENMLLQWTIAEPGVLPHTINLLRAYSDEGYPINYGRVGEVFSTIVDHHVPLGHTSEIAWVLWGHLLLDFRLDKQVARLVTRIPDAVVALLFLDLRDRRLVDRQISMGLWENLMEEEELQGRHWLLAYEARVRHWLPSRDGTDYIRRHDGFRLLRRHRIRFYNRRAVDRYVVPGRYLRGAQRLPYQPPAP